MTNKYIIDNQSSLIDAQALSLIVQVVSMGKISSNGLSYCFGTSFEVDGLMFFVCCLNNKRSFKFVVRDD